LISVEYCRLLARHNRGAFCGSLHRTLNHILWGDRVWLGRFVGVPFEVAPYGADMVADFSELARERETADMLILDWAGKLSPAWLEGMLSYRRSSDGGARELPAWIAATHLFQHAVHHRGQASALLMQARHDIGATDLPQLPGVVRVVD
jgi:uncharacterized damage-inducible protein DinB